MMARHILAIILVGNLAFRSSGPDGAMAKSVEPRLASRSEHTRAQRQEAAEDIMVQT